MSVCIITGATSGIGRATCIALSKTKIFSQLVLIGRDEAKLNETISLMDHKCKIMPIVFDLESLQKIPEMIDRVYNACGGINALLNIAGYTDPKSLLMTDLESFEKTYRINVSAPFMLIKSCVKYMRKVSGQKKILNVASTAGITPRPGWLSYASSKAALIAMSSTLTDELAEYGISVYCISPGRCATPLRKKLAPEEDPATIMQPEAVAEVIVKLMNETEFCLDGQNIIIRKKI